MPTPTIQLGVPLAMEEDLAYALPIRGSLIFVDPEDADLSVSIDEAFTNAVAITPSAEGLVETAAPFIRANDEGITIIAKVNT